MLITEQEIYEKLKPYSHEPVVLQCDYCRKKFTRRKANHLGIKRKSSLKKDACKSCVKIKNAEECLVDWKCKNTQRLINFMLLNKSTKLSGVYALRNIHENKSYIGSSKNIIDRIKSHLIEIENETHHCKPLIECGSENIEVIILEHDLDEEYLTDKEYIYIKLFHTGNPKFGYNKMQAKKNSPRRKKYKDIGYRLKRSNLTIQEVECIKKALYEGVRIKTLAEQLGINYATIHSIKSCSTWENVLPHLNKRLKNMKYLGISRGSKNSCSKLNEQQVKEIKHKIKSNVPIVSIAKQYEVSSTLIGHIKRGKLWSHVS
ncbi:MULTISPECIES: GIY-YIG nuclease family protein [Bacillus]|uniref:GIY-YIG nuclease family protein n=1 Tax=Bacillus TaxID=1386 RepID=UPI000952F78C|nr:GIY-YIG nuclease family protein [Bacillus licheniformis]OLQ50055.1 hypothetical protein BHT96_07860 [Bacillus licheniformis]PAE74101.1 hypothetical protein CHH84_01920 [Bacillus licheniformis]TWN27940.1 hypothetical protein CHCC14557_4027 [Bacillus licheniformis]